MISAQVCSDVEPLQTECRCTPTLIVVTGRFVKQCAAESTQSFAIKLPPQKPELLCATEP